MRVGIVGSREFSQLDLVREYVRKLPEDSVVVSGGADGVDTIAAKEADNCGLDIDEKKPEIDKYGIPAAFHIRNQEIVNESDTIIAFWDGESDGTWSTISKAIKAGIPTNIYIRN